MFKIGPGSLSYTFLQLPTHMLMSCQSPQITQKYKVHQTGASRVGVDSPILPRREQDWYAEMQRRSSRNFLERIRVKVMFAIQWFYLLSLQDQEVSLSVFLSGNCGNHGRCDTNERKTFTRLNNNSISLMGSKFPLTSNFPPVQPVRGRHDACLLLLTSLRSCRLLPSHLGHFFGHHITLII